jgi:proton-translocating NADH-quinone oxidoreductase chain N
MSFTNLMWLIIVPLVSSPVIYLAGRLTSRSFRFHYKYNLSRWIALTAVLISWIPLIGVINEMRAGLPVEIQAGLVNFHFDGISLILTLSTLTLGTLAILFSGKYLSKEEGEEKFYALFSLMMGSIIGLSCATDLFNLWIWFEIMAISTYTLVAFYRNLPGALEAGVKYLVQSALGSVFVLLGIALVFGQTGTLDLAAIKDYYLVTPGLLAAGGLFVIGFGVKAALVPLHTWLPDAHSQAPSGISAMLSGVVIEAGLIALLRVLGALSHVSNMWGGLLLGLGALNMIIGNLMALRQTQIKRMLAYSSISHVGYIITGLGIAISYQVPAGASGAMFHLINHALMKGLAFLACGVFLYVLIIRHGKHQPLNITDLRGASMRYPLEALALSVALLALGGLPPLSGFMSKWVIFTAGFQSGQPWVYAAVIFMALNSVLSLGYYAPVVNQLYQRDQSALVQTGKSVPLTMKIPLVILTLATIVLGFYPVLLQWFYNLAGSSIMTLFS